jgi:phospholipid N-methyltransferase
VNADAGVFFALWLQKPLRIAAANPSGALADAVARCIAGQEVCRVWRNLLPAQVWAYSERTLPLDHGALQ